MSRKGDTLNSEWKKEYDEMLKIAVEARKRSYSPYSNFAVGAALKTKDGKIFPGCNVENAMYGAAICAERSALLSAVSNGFQDFDGILILGNSGDKKNSEFCPPCAFCRQTLLEFVEPEQFKVILAKTDEQDCLLDSRIYTMDELYPVRFDSSFL